MQAHREMTGNIMNAHSIQTAAGKVLLHLDMLASKLGQLLCIYLHLDLSRMTLRLTLLFSLPLFHAVQPPP